MSIANVTALPTAAPRQVKQPETREARQARRAFRAENPWPGRYSFPAERDSERHRELEGRILAGISLTPELAILIAMMRAMPAAALEGLIAVLDLLPDFGDSASLEQARVLASQAAVARRAMERICGADGRGEQT